MGYGDEIIATAEAKEAKKKFSKAKILIGDGKKIHPSLMYLNNPNIFQNSKVEYTKDWEQDSLRRDFSMNAIEGDYIWILNYINNRPYVDYLNSNSERIIWDNKFSAKPGEIYLSNSEKKLGIGTIKNATKLWEDNFSKRSNFTVVIEPNVKSTNYKKITGSSTIGYSNINRDWGFDKWQSVVNALKDRIIFIQPYKGDVRKLSNVVHIDCNFRGALSVLNQCDMFLGTHSGYSHAAAALKKDAINIFGGWISPEIMGYKLHTNYYVDLTDSPCGSIQICNHCKNCMDQIKVEDIISSLEQKIINKKL